MKVLGLENVTRSSGEVTLEPSAGGILGMALRERQAERQLAEYMESNIARYFEPEWHRLH
jgi:hypothetical protein